VSIVVESSPAQPNIPDTRLSPASLASSGKLPQTLECSRMGSSAICNRRKPICCIKSIRCGGFCGWRDQLQTARRSRKGEIILKWLSELQDNFRALLVSDWRRDTNNHSLSNPGWVEG